MTSAPSDTLDRMSEALRRSLLANDQLRRRHQALLDATQEPIAIVGMGCRLPGGVTSPDDLWKLVSEGRDAIGAFPDNRGWDLEELLADDPGLAASRGSWRGGFLKDAGEFDAAFFGISPREALAMDPQQRLLLEIAWETIEAAHIAPRTLRGKQVGVFVGAPEQGYVPSVDRRVPEIDGYRLQGGLSSIASGRIAYTLGLNGPAITIDTACSSSLVAIHLAMRALRNGDCTMALAGGAMVMSTPDVFVEFIRQGGLASDGRCKAFADGADGTGFAEGCGLVLLERLSDARQAGHPILGVIRGSAINQDGASNGLTAPSMPAQAQVITRALANAGLSATDIDLIEAHGTGTALGDPIEAQALIDTYGRTRDAGRPLWLGSLKSNIGHAQIAAGVAGVIKTVMALRHRHMPPTLHAAVPSSHIAWPGDDIRLLNRGQAWHVAQGPRRAAVSSFGISGTNAHVILEEAPLPEDGTAAPAPAIQPPGQLIALSAASEAAFKARAGQIAALLRVPDAPGVEAVASALSRIEGAFSNRALLQAPDQAALLAALDGLASGQTAAGVIQGGGLVAGRTIFLFTGQGAQWPGMGRDLAAASPVFAQSLNEICDLFDTHLPRPLREIMWAAPDSDDARLLSRTDFTQAALFTVEVSLYRLVTHLGATADAVAGHSIGEIAAAHVAGIFSLDDAVRFVAARGRLMQELPAGGAMIAIEASEAEIAQALDGHHDRAAIAAINAPNSIVISGDAEIVADFAASWSAQGRRTHRLQVSHAFHSPRIAPIVAPLRQALDTLKFSAPDIDVISTVTGQFLTNEEARSADYWADQARAPVRFADAVIFSMRDHATTWLELGPDAVLTTLARMTMAAAGQERPEFACVASLRRNADGVRATLSALGRLYTRGAPITWNKVMTAPGAVALPAYPFQHRHFWLVAPPLTGGSSPGIAAVGHPLLVHRIELAGEDAWRLTGRVSTAGQPWLREHAVGGVATAPGALTAEMMLRAGRELGCERLETIALQAPVIFPDERDVSLQLHVQAADSDGRRVVDAYSRAALSDEEPGWRRYATGVIAPVARVEKPVWNDLKAWPPEGGKPVDIAGMYERLEEVGVGLGPDFFRVDAAWRTPDGIYVDVTLPEALIEGGSGFTLHPLLLDSGMQAALIEAMTTADGAVNAELRMLFSIGGLTLHGVAPTAIRAHLALSDKGPGLLRISDQQGNAVATVETIVLRKAGGPQARPNVRPYHLAWNTAKAPFERTKALSLHQLGGEGTLPQAAQLEEAAQGGYDAVVLFCPHDNDERPDRAALHVAAALLPLLQAWIADPRTIDCPLVVATRGVIAVTGSEDVSALDQSGVWGMVRTAQREHPGRLRLLDLDISAPEPEDLYQAIGVLLAGEQMAALRRGSVLNVRLSKHADADCLSLPEGQSWHLIRNGAGGSVTDVMLAPFATPSCGPHDILVGVRATGLNFRDLLITLGTYPHEASLGCEMAGVVVAIGSAVTRRTVGERVMGMGWAGTIATVAMTDERHVTPMPDGWSFAEAATIPSAFLTAWQAMVVAGGLRPGQRVLIHSATGGVGMAAVAIARHLGAETFATCHPAKAPLLHALGIAHDHCASSRDTGFVSAFQDAGGMDLILHGLSGPLAQASLGLLAPGGRLIDIANTDIPEMDAARGRVTFTLSTDPEITANAFEALRALFAQKALHPLPVTSFDVRRAPEALRLMRDGLHVGRIVLTIPRAIDPEGTVLITGGTGGLGNLAARHLVSHHGVRHLVVVSRRGEAAPRAQTLREELAALGAEIRFIACDLSDEQTLRTIVQDIMQTRPLTAILHAAGTAEPTAFAATTPGHVARMMRGKADAAWTLHEATRGADLAAFVLYSSAVSVLGLADQANYAAANSFLDALATHRHHLGLPVSSLAWGVWEARTDMGDAIGADYVQQIVEAGFQPMSAAEGLAFLDAGITVGIASDMPVLLPMRLTPRVLAEQSDPLLAGLAPKTSVARRASTIVQDLASLPDAEQRVRLLALIGDHARAVLRDDGLAITSGTSFRSIGFDSLTAVEMSNRLAGATGVSLPPTAVFDHETLELLAAYIQNSLHQQPTKATTRSDLTNNEKNLSEDKQSTLGALLRRAILDGRAVEGLRVMEAVAALRPSFSQDDAVNHAEPVVWLRREGEDRPLLVCIDSFIPSEGHLTYQKLSRVLGDVYDMAAIALPGYRSGQPLPATREALGTALATAVQAAVGQRPFTLLGFSTGGLAAHVTAQALEADNAPARGIMLIDTFPAGTMDNASLSSVLSDWASARGAFWSNEEEGLSAMAWYLSLFATHWQPATLQTPSYLARAEQRIAMNVEDDWEKLWPNLAAWCWTPGSHFALLTGHVTDTAKAVEKLLAEGANNKAAIALKGDPS